MGSHSVYDDVNWVIFIITKNIHQNENKSHLYVDFCKKLYIIESRKEGEVAIMLIQFNLKNTNPLEKRLLWICLRQR